VARGEILYCGDLEPAIALELRTCPSCKVLFASRRAGKLCSCCLNQFPQARPG
jgi:hypothetical protein